MAETLPRHVAIIMDGNGRWAKRRFLPRKAGHKAGMKVAHKIVEAAAKTPIDVLSLFVFSSENWRRPPEEVEFLMRLFLNGLKQDIKKLHKNNIQLRIIGDRSQFSEDLQQAIVEAEGLTHDNTGMTLCLAANYGGQWDILQAAQTLANQVQKGELSVADITKERFSQALITHDLPNPDLFIRTSGEIRISNFFLWQLSYSELYFTDLMWPEFTVEEFAKAISCFGSRKRRFGHSDEQIEEHHA